MDNIQRARSARLKRCLIHARIRSARLRDKRLLVNVIRNSSSLSRDTSHPIQSLSWQTYDLHNFETQSEAFTNIASRTVVQENGAAITETFNQLGRVTTIPSSNYCGYTITNVRASIQTWAGLHMPDTPTSRACNLRTTTNRRSTSYSHRKFAEPWDFGLPDELCNHCGAVLWYEERNEKSKNPSTPKFSLCCQEGKIQLPLLKIAPPFLEDLLRYDGGRPSNNFRENIRAYNSIFAFTSTGASIDNSINNGVAPYVYRTNGQNHHRIGSLLPMAGQNPKFAQLYIYDTENEVHNRMSTLGRLGGPSTLDVGIVSELVKMIDEHNELAKAFRLARDRFRESDLLSIRIRLIGSRSTDPNVYNLPSASEVAALIVGDLTDTNSMRDIIVDHKSQGLQRISELHPSFMAMQYPLLFPYGEDGFHIGLTYAINEGKRKTKRSCVTMREYYAYRLQQRVNESQTIFRSGRLLQQFLVDSYTCIEEERLRWVRLNQPQLRAELYKGIKNAVLRGDTTPSSVGKRIVLPSSFTGGPRYMAQNFQDAMAICRWAGNPDLFITFTANPKWAEIQHFLNLIPRQKPDERPDIISRVFKIKLDHLMKDLTKGKRFGRVMAAIYTIEFQKRGLPHAHIVLYLHPEDKHMTPTDVEKIISAEIPDKDTNPIGYAAVGQFMMHGPCGSANQTSPCMKKGTCSKHFPKMFCSQTTFDDNGFPVYKRRDDGSFIEKNKIKLDNRFVVPHNVDLVIKYQAHINVEYCNKARSIKYLFKYMNKGPDRTRMVLEETRVQATTNGTEAVVEIDEIKSFLDCRYLSACEASWRIFQFDIQYRSIGVERLTFHLPEEHTITFRDSDHLDNVLNIFNVEKTMFTQWMETNVMHEDARELTYADFPKKWVWVANYKQWKRRETGKCIGRIVYAHPTSGERFYLRMLLYVVRGPRSYEEIRTVNGITYPTYKSACYALGLLDDDGEWHDAMAQAAQWSNGAQLRELFAVILMFCEVSDPLKLWDDHWQLLSEDILYRQRNMLKFPTMQMTETQLRNYALYEIEQILSRNGKSLRDFTPIPLPDHNLIQELSNRLIREEVSYDTRQLMYEHIKLYEGLNEEQLNVYNVVIASIFENKGGLYFVYGAGGTGKTHLYKTILSRLRSEGKIVLVVASSGVASLLVPGGRTAHSRFGIPIDATD